MPRRIKLKCEFSIADSNANMNGNVLRQMSITESFKKAKLSTFKFEKPVIVSSVPIEIDSDSEIELSPVQLNCDKTESNASAADDEEASSTGSPAKRIRSSLQAFEIITSTPKTPGSSKTTPNISFAESSTAAILPSQTVTKDSPESNILGNITYNSDRTLLYDYTVNTFDASTTPFTRIGTLGSVGHSNIDELLEINYIDDSTQDAVDSFPQAVVPNHSRPGNSSEAATKQRLNFEKIDTIIGTHTELNCSSKRPGTDQLRSNNNPKSCEGPSGVPKRKARTKKRARPEQKSNKQTTPSDQQINVTQKIPNKVNSESTCSLSPLLKVGSANPKSFRKKSERNRVDRQHFTSKSEQGPVNGHKSCISTSIDLSPVITHANENTNIVIPNANENTNINKMVVHNEESPRLIRTTTVSTTSVSQNSVATSERLIQNGENSYSRNSFADSPSTPVSKNNSTIKILKTVNQTVANKITPDMSSGKKTHTEKNLNCDRNHDCDKTLNTRNRQNTALVVLPIATPLKLGDNSPSCTTTNRSSGLEVQNGQNTCGGDNNRQIISSMSKEPKSVPEKPSSSTTEQQNNDTNRNEQLMVNEQPSCSKSPTTTPVAKPNTKLMQKTPSSPTKANILKSRSRNGSPWSPSKGSPNKTREIKSLKAKEGKQLQIKQLDELVALLKMVASNRYLKSLLSPQEYTILKQFVQMEDNHKYVVMKLYVWKRIWYNIFKFCSKAKIQADDKGIIECFNFLKKENFVDSDYRGEMDMIDLLQEMEVKQIKQVMEELRITYKKQGTKMELINRIIWATNSQATLGRKTLKDMVMDVIEKKLGFAIKIRDEVCEAFYHSYLLATFTNPNFEDIQTYFRDIIYNRVVFPTAPIEDCIVFYSREKFVRYAEALKVEKDLEELLSHRDNHFRISSLGEKTYQRLTECPNDSVDHVNMPHLTRFTAEHVNSRILTKCCERVFTKERGKPVEVKKWLEYLIERFPQSSRLWKWYHKLIWLHMRHLPEISYKPAAKILIEVFETKRHLLGESGEFELGSLGVRLKKSAKHRLDQIYHDRISELIPSSIDITTFPQNEIDSQCIRSEVSGRKRIYTSKSDGEMTARHVEQVALEYYAENGYPGGEHCEGSIIRALCMLYFWDIIYNPKKSVPGTFISKLQTAPLDMFTPYFYKNRRNLIDSRINKISYKWSQEKLIQFGKNNWQQHSHVLSAFGTLMNVIKDVDTIEVLLKTIGREVLARIFQRLIKNIGEFSSGMPDLLVWNIDQKTHKFVEVKGEGDKLSCKQTLWLKYLQDIGANIEVCNVHSTGSKRKHIKKVSNENAKAGASTSNIGEENEGSDDYDDDAD